MATDDLVMEGTRSSTPKILTYLAKNKPASTQCGLVAICMVVYRIVAPPKYLHMILTFLHIILPNMKKINIIIYMTFPYTEVFVNTGNILIHTRSTLKSAFIFNVTCLKICWLLVDGLIKGQSVMMFLKSFSTNKSLNKQLSCQQFEMTGCSYDITALNQQPE